MSGVAGEESELEGERVTISLTPRGPAGATEDSRSTMLDRHCRLDVAGILPTAATVREQGREREERSVIADEVVDMSSILENSKEYSDKVGGRERE